MPIYHFRSRTTDGSEQAEELGFYHDDAALGHALRIARGGAVEVWRDSQLVGSVDERPRAEPAGAQAA